MMKRIARLRVPLGFLFAGIVLWLADPTPRTLMVGAVIALAGEAVRLWAAGHLEKSREVTRSGPYRFMRHPLYVGSTVIALGAVIAAWHPVVAFVAALYMGATVTAAIHTEEAHLRRSFGETYDQYRESRAEPMQRRFSMERALRNREYRAMAGLAAGFALLALKVLAPI